MSRFRRVHPSTVIDDRAAIPAPLLVHSLASLSFSEVAPNHFLGNWFRADPFFLTLVAVPLMILPLFYKGTELLKLGGLSLNEHVEEGLMLALAILSVLVMGPLVPWVWGAAAALP